MKKHFSLLLGFALIVCALIACGEANNTGQVVGNSNTPTTQTTKATTTHFKVGDIVKVGTNWEVIVNSVKTSQGDDFIKPGAGNIYVIVNVTVKNVSNQGQNISSLLNFTFKAADGTEGKQSILSSGVSPAPDGQIAAGDLVKGDLVYEVPTAQKQFTLAFTPDIVSNGQSIWDINL